MKKILIMRSWSLWIFLLLFFSCHNINYDLKNMKINMQIDSEEKTSSNFIKPYEEFHKNDMQIDSGEKISNSLIYNCLNDLKNNAIYEVYIRDLLEINSDIYVRQEIKTLLASDCSKDYLILKKLLSKKKYFIEKTKNIHSIVSDYIGTLFDLPAISNDIEELLKNTNYKDIFLVLGKLYSKNELKKKIQHYLKYNNRSLKIDKNNDTSIDLIVNNIINESELDKNFNYLLHYDNLDIIYLLLCIIKKVNVNGIEYKNLVNPAKLSLRLFKTNNFYNLTEGINLILKCKASKCNMIMPYKIGLDYGIDNFGQKRNYFDAGYTLSNLYCNFCAKKTLSIKRIILFNCNYNIFINKNNSEEMNVSGGTFFIKCFEIDFVYNCIQMIVLPIV